MSSTTKSTNNGKSSSGSDSKSKAKVNKKMQQVMHEFKHGELQSGNSSKKVTNSKQAVAIGLSEARKAGAKIPPPAKKQSKPKRTPSTKV